MSFKMSANKGNGEGIAKAPAGNHPAVLVAIIDMGTQKSDFQGVEKWQHRAFFVWELVNEVVAGTKDKHHLIGIDLTLSLNEKAKLRKWIEARTGKPLADGSEFDAASELGKPCLLNVIDKGGYPKIDAVTAFPKGFPEPKPQQQPFAWSLDTFHTNGRQINLPDWVPYFYGRPIADTIRECKEIGETRSFSGGAQGDGGQSKPLADAPTANNFGGGATPAKAPPKLPPKAAPKGEPADESQWQVFCEGVTTEWQQMTGKEVREMFAKNGVVPEVVHVCPLGSEDHTTADKVGFTNIPW